MNDAIAHTILKYFQEQAIKEGYTISKCRIQNELILYRGSPFSDRVCLHDQSISDGPSYIEAYKYRTINLIINIVLYLPSDSNRQQLSSVANLYIKKYKTSAKNYDKILKNTTVHRIDINNPNMLNKLDDMLQQPLQQ